MGSSSIRQVCLILCCVCILAVSFIVLSFMDNVSAESSGTPEEVAISEVDKYGDITKYEKYIVVDTAYIPADNSGDKSSDSFGLIAGKVSWIGTDVKSSSEDQWFMNIKDSSGNELVIKVSYEVYSKLKLSEYYIRLDDKDNIRVVTSDEYGNILDKQKDYYKKYPNSEYD